MRADRAGDAGEQRVNNDEADPKVCTRECGTGIESKPAEGENEGAKDNHRHVMARHCLRLAMRIVLADSCPNTDSTGQPNEPAHPVNNTRTREVNGSVAKTPVDAALSEPASAPEPVCIEAVR